MMNHLARNIKQLFEEEKEEALTNIPETENQGSSTEPQTSEAIQQVKDILADPKFMAQKGIRSLIDLDARVGRKGKNQSFYGYKTEFMMTTDERIITSVRTSDGAAMTVVIRRVC